MTGSRIAFGALVSMLLGLGSGCSHLQSTAAEPGSDVVVAEYAGTRITQAELDDFVRRDLFDRESKRGPSRLYELRSAALERMINERLVDRAREGSGLDSDAWVESRVQASGGVTPSEVADFYEKNKERMDGAPLEQVSAQISRYLAAEKGARVVSELRKDAVVAIRLVQPRLAVEAVGPSQGPADARVTIIEFSDFQCPFCKREAPVMREVLAKYPNDVRVVYRQLPLSNIHPRAQAAAEASLCAHEQGKFWEYHDGLFDSPGSFSDADFARLAKVAGLDAKQHASCLAEGRTAAQVAADAAAAEAARITGTPAFVINGILLAGAKPASEFIELIDKELAAAKAPESTPPAAATP
jgi:protein-disulfide isomerase